MKESEVKNLLKQNNYDWKEFLEFMEGQTVGIYPNGETDFYDKDVDRFIIFKKQIEKYLTKIKWKLRHHHKKGKTLEWD